MGKKIYIRTYVYLQFNMRSAKRYTVTGQYEMDKEIHTFTGQYEMDEEIHIFKHQYETVRVSYTGTQ